MKRIVILGAGFGGLATAAGLSEGLGDGYEITLIDKSDAFFIGFSKIDVLFGRRTPAQVSYPYANLRADVRFVQEAITAIDTGAQRVTTSGGSWPYDTLVVALGAELDYDATPGFRESGAHEFYSLEGAARLAPVLESFSSGRLVMGILGVPYKCPPAPYEVAFQLHDRLVERGVRDDIVLQMVIPGARPLPNPKVADIFERLLAERQIGLVAGAPIRSLEADRQRVVTDAAAIDYDLFVGVPVHRPPAVVRESGLSDGGFIRPSPVNLETSAPDVYAIGDVTHIPVGDKAVPKAGAFAEDAARTVVSDILLKEGLRDDRVPFRARGACYVDLGGGQVAKIKANFLGGDQPEMALEGPSAQCQADKAHFESARRDGWFETG